ncbi:hypothetical protein F4779DRAFT_621420 [Xylariaceae sp. FL0662B]|nr:hypothetical protein F4779DRAFT_621420 [Xylariaceae sp. FL0662B]
MSLLALPNELLLQIMEHLGESRSIQALQSASCTCKTLQQIAEKFLYSTAVFTKRSSLRRFQEAISAQPRRNRYVQDLKLLFSTRQYEHDDRVATPDLVSFPNLQSFVSESPECQPWSKKGIHRLKVDIDASMRAFQLASLLSECSEVDRPLQNLTSLTLHWSGVNGRYWDISPMCPIFLLPRLKSLEISCAKIGQPSRYQDYQEKKGEADSLRRFRHQTQLKSLILTECTVAVDAFESILSFPIALQRLDLYETSHHSEVDLDDCHATDVSDWFNRAIKQQSDTLESLLIRCRGRTFHAPYQRDDLNLELSEFRALSLLQLSSFYTPRAVRYYFLEHPVPPRLTTLCLDDYSVLGLTSPKSDRVFSSMLLDELLANASARRLPFTFDLVLHSLPPYFRRGPRDQRPVVRQLVEKFAEQFSRHKPCSGQSETSSGQPSDNQDFARLRVFTKKRVHCIPPYLHNEPLPRLVERYDSWHPQRFVGDTPVTKIEEYLDEDVDTDDEDMDVAFSVVEGADLSFLA